MNAEFITPAVALNHPKLWKTFPAGQAAQATLEITGLGLYRAFLNGKRVGQDYLTPGYNDYDAYLRYQTYDVTALLQEENCLEVYLGDGWYKGRFGFGKNNFNLWGDQYLLWAKLTITDQKGLKQVISTDDTWLAAFSPFLSSGIYDGESRDDTRPQGDPTPCKTVSTAYQLTPQFSPPIRMRTEVKPTLIRTPKGEQVLDFGQNLVGVLRFVNRLPRGKKLYIQTGEVLQQGCFYRDNLRSAKSEFTYISDGQIKDVEQFFTFYGFRYAKVEGLDPVDPADFTAVVLCSDLKETLKCETGHPLVNQLMRNTLWGQRSNFLDVPTDCPQRDERLGWTGDTQVFADTACYQMDCKDFYRKFMRDLREDQLRYCDGNLPMFSPSLKGKGGKGGAVWSDVGTILPWCVYMHYGDRALLEESYPMMRDLAEALIREDQEAGGTHLVFTTHTFGDWLSQDGLTPQDRWGGTLPAYIQGVYYHYSLHLTALAAKELGKEADAQKYAALAEEIRQALLDEYVSPNGRLTVDTQTGYVLALRYGIYRDKEKMIQGLRRRLERDFYRIMGGFTGAPLTLDVLLDCGLEDAAYRMLLSEEFPGWLYCVKLGATTIWERWNSLNPDGTISGTDMNSLNHYAYGSVCEAIYSRMIGLKCAAPGWKKALIAPRMDGRLGHASIQYDSAAGTWKVSWELREDGTAVLLVTVPAGAEAEIHLPDHPEHMTVTVGSGDHRFTWPLTRDYLHPFSRDSLVLDLIKRPETAGIMREMEPDLVCKCMDQEPRLLLRTAAQALPPEEADRLDEALKKVHVQNNY